MSILIKGIPLGGYEISIMKDGDKWRARVDGIWCEVEEIKAPHGRLIDADAHILEIRKQYCKDCSRRKGIKNGKMKFLYEIGGVVCRACEIEDMLNELDEAPTVIEAEGEA
jgi:hypothetical protein